MSHSIAIYHRPDADPKVHPCRPGATPGTVDLLGDDGEPIVTDCRVIEDPETEVYLPIGFATIVEPVKKAPSPRRSRKDADGDGEPD